MDHKAWTWVNGYLCRRHLGEQKSIIDLRIGCGINAGFRITLFLHGVTQLSNGFITPSKSWKGDLTRFVFHHFDVNKPELMGRDSWRLEMLS